MLCHNNKFITNHIWLLLHYFLNIHINNRYNHLQVFIQHSNQCLTLVSANNTYLWVILLHIDQFMVKHFKKVILILGLRIIQNPNLLITKNYFSIVVKILYSLNKEMMKSINLLNLNAQGDLTMRNKHLLLKQLPQLKWNNDKVKAQKKSHLTV